MMTLTSATQGHQQLTLLDLLEKSYCLLMGHTLHRTTVDRKYLITFAENSQSLSVGKDCFNVDAHVSLGTVFAPDDGKAQALLTGTFLELGRLNRVLRVVVGG